MLIGIDIGGTFTDLVCVTDGGLVTAKVPSTPDDPARGALKGLEDVLDAGEGQAEAIAFLAHGTTVATNALIERRGVRTALVATKGFRDVLEIGRLYKPSGHMYDIQYERPPALVPRRLRFEVDERVGADGEVLQALDPGEVRRLAARLREEEVDAVAVALLFSYLRPEHENTIAEVLADELPGASIFLSSRVWPEMREYERTALAATTAYVGPLVSSYLERIGREVESIGAGTPLHVMQSTGGLASAASAVAKPALLALSGPAGGVVSAQEISRQTGLENLVALDMGGTSTDVSVIIDYLPTRTTERTIHDVPLIVPMLDIEAVGAGGGSVAWIDPAGRLRVGPRSAGAVPGPAAYGRGGEEPTVTDADLLLGYLNREHLLGGRMRVHVDRARAAIEEHVARPLDIGVPEAAGAIRRLVNAAMANAIRLMTVARGHDPREFGLVAFGGAGPVHAVDLADELEIPWIVVPPHPGITSAIGLAVSDVVHDHVRTVRGRLDTLDLAAIDEQLEAMERAATEELRIDGVPEDRQRLMRSVDVRYSGQGHALNLPLDAGRLGESEVAALEHEFHARHEERYGFHDDDRRVEVVNLRLRAVGESSRRVVQPAELPPEPPQPPSPVGERDVHFAGGPVAAVPVLDRAAVAPGCVLRGPCILEQPDSTVVVPPGRTATVDAHRNMIVGKEVFRP